ncbi:hypothetical protein Q7P36_001368 [Cladosporium allicinum]
MASSGKHNSNIAHLTPDIISNWPAPNYDNPDRITWLPIYSSVWFGAATILLGLRYWLRIRGHAGRLGLDDAIIFPGWLAGLMFTAVSIIYTSYAHGDRHVWDAPPEKRTTLVLCMWLGEFSFLVCGGCTKVSILLFYRRLVTGTYSKRYKWLIWFAIAFTIAYTFTFCVVLLANCTPTSAYWMAFDFKYALTQDYQCMDTSVINAMAGVCAAISDVYSVALPCFLTWQLNSVPKAQKIALFGIFSLGLVVVAASGVRTYWLIETGVSKDITRSAFNLFIWAQFELQAGIICAAAPSLRVFFRRYLGGSYGSRNALDDSYGPKTGHSMGHATNKSHQITVRKDTSVTFNHDSDQSTESLTEHADKMPPIDNKWSPLPVQNPHAVATVAAVGTRYSHEEDSIAMSDFNWKGTGREMKSASQV